MVRAVEGSQRIVQTGTQQRSWEHWKIGKEIVASGRLGKVTMVHHLLVSEIRRQKRPGENRPGGPGLEKLFGQRARPAF